MLTTGCVLFYAGYLNGGKYQYQDTSGYNLDNQALVFQIQIPKSAKPS